MYSRAGEEIFRSLHHWAGRKVETKKETASDIRLQRANTKYKNSVFCAALFKDDVRNCCVGDVMRQNVTLISIYKSILYELIWTDI